MPALLAQEPALQFGVRYQCKDGNTYIVSRCAAAGKGEFCFYEQIQNGVSLGEGYTTRPQMEARVKPCDAQRPSAPPAAKPQTIFNPPYLKEMPAADRIKKEITGTDPVDTEARQMGAFWWLQQIIYDMALSQNRDRYHMTPDEAKAMEPYIAEYRILFAKLDKDLSAPKDRKRFSDLGGYTVDNDIRDELFKRFFSPTFAAQYAATDAIFAARHNAVIKAGEEATKAAEDKDKHERAVAKCIVSGRNPLTCTGAAVGAAFNELLGGIAPSAAKTLAPGLRLNGKYHRGDFEITFVHDSVAFSCGPLMPDSHSYRVDQKGAVAIVTVDNQPAPFAFALAPETGVIAGPAAADVTGRVPIGGTRTVTRYDANGVGTLLPSTPMYEIRTVRCDVGTMPPGGPAKPPDLGDIPVLGAIVQQMSGVREFQTVAGLRMAGLYEGPTGFSVEFSADQSVMVSCRQSVVARDYTVAMRAGVTTIAVQNGTQPFTLTLRPDGTLTGTGTVGVAGRVITGQDAAGNPTFAPRNDSCAIGTLAPAK